MVSVFKNVGDRSAAKNYCPISLLSVVSKVFEKFLNNRIVNHLSGFSLVRENLDNLEKALIFEKVRENLEKAGNFTKFFDESGKSQGNFLTCYIIFLS